MAKMNIWT